MERPSTVPADAIWNAAENEWELGQKQGAKYRGEVIWWRPDGSLVCRSTFDDRGELDGVSRRYHPDGSISLESRYVHGTRWGKTWHTRSAKGGSPEDMHMMQLPANIHRLEMVYVGGTAAPFFASLTREGADAPPAIENGMLVDFASAIHHYVPGTVFRPIGGPFDIADRLVDVPALWYRGLATTDASMLRFNASEQSANLMTDPTATVLTMAEASAKLVVAVDFIDALIIGDRMSKGIGTALVVKDGAATVREVMPGSPASQLDVRAGDRLVSLNDHEIRSVRDYMAGVVDHARTQRTAIVIERDGKRHALG